MEKRRAASALSIAGMTSIDSVTLEVADTTAAQDFYTTAFGWVRVRLRASEAATTGSAGSPSR